MRAPPSREREEKRVVHSYISISSSLPPGKKKKDSVSLQKKPISSSPFYHGKKKGRTKLREGKALLFIRSSSLDEEKEKKWIKRSGISRGKKAMRLHCTPSGNTHVAARAQKGEKRIGAGRKREPYRSEKKKNTANSKKKGRGCASLRSRGEPKGRTLLPLLLHKKKIGDQKKKKQHTILFFLRKENRLRKGKQADLSPMALRKGKK